MNREISNSCYLTVCCACAELTMKMTGRKMYSARTGASILSCTLSRKRSNLLDHQTISSGAFGDVCEFSGSIKKQSITLKCETFHIQAILQSPQALLVKYLAIFHSDSIMY